jgi:hypothetical protein
MLLEIGTKKKYLAAKLEVTHYNSDFGTSQNQNDKDNEQESKNVIELVSPNSSQNKEELNKHSSKRQNSSHQNGEDGVHVPHLIWNLSRDLVGSDRGLRGRLLEGKVATQQTQGQTDSKPKSH